MRPPVPAELTREPCPACCEPGVVPLAQEGVVVQDGQLYGSVLHGILCLSCGRLA